MTTTHCLALRGSHCLLSFCLLAFNPAHNLSLVEDHFAAGPGAEMRESFGNPRVPNAPRRTAKQSSDLPNIKGLAKAVCRTRARWLATRGHRWSRAMGRVVLPYGRLHYL